MGEQSPLTYRLTLYASTVAGIMFGLYGYWIASVPLLLVAIVMQWRRALPSKFEWTRWMGVICMAAMIAIDIYGMIDPQVEPFFG
jgi:hypothetical protein